MKEAKEPPYEAPRLQTYGTLLKHTRGVLLVSSDSTNVFRPK